MESNQENQQHEDKFFGIVSERRDAGSDPYCTPECEAFCEGYAAGIKKTTKDIASDIDEFYYMLSLYDDYRKTKS